MAAITCYVADYNLSPGMPVVTEFTLRNDSLASPYFAKLAGVPALDVAFDWSLRDSLPASVGKVGVCDGDLIDALTKLLAGAPASPTSIGLLLTDLYAPAISQFGYMFDLDGEGTTIGARRGCAIFLQSLQLALPNAASPTALADFLAFTVLHELGHAVNLWHQQDTSIMQPYPDPSALGSCSFDNEHLQFLALAANPDESPYVLPGGTPYGIRPPGWYSDADQPFEGPKRAKSPLQIRIALSHSEFWSFEPVELTVELRVRNSKVEPLSIPDELDPGFSSFQIWITRPDGERFRFRPGRRFCQPNGTRVIARDAPFSCDIPIFRQSSGYTFTAPGQYRVQTFLRLSSGEYISSNVIDQCRVLPSEVDSPAWRAGRGALGSTEARTILRYKHRQPAHHCYASLNRFADEDASSETRAGIHYALGRSLVRASERSPAGTVESHLRARGVEHLRKALDRKYLSRGRREAIESIITTNAPADMRVGGG
jgi:hypothetical protein